MKKLLFIPALLTIAILFTACGGDDRPSDLPVTMKASAEKTFPSFLAAEGVVQNLEVTFNLTDFPGVSKYKDWIKDADAPMSNETYIVLKGIGEDEVIELRDVSLSLASNPVQKFPFPSTTITGNVEYLADRGTRVDFFQAIMDEIKSKGSSKVVLNYTPGADTNTDGKMTIKIEAEFIFN